MTPGAVRVHQRIHPPFEFSTQHRLPRPRTLRHCSQELFRHTAQLPVAPEEMEEINFVDPPPISAAEVDMVEAQITALLELPTSRDMAAQSAHQLWLSLTK